MGDIASIASSAVSAYQRALGTVSNNIANASTTGYARQVSTLEANPVSKMGNIFMGTGVAATGISRAYDSFVEANYRNSNSDLLSQEPMVNYTNRIVDVMGSDSMGLSSALDQFFNTARLLSTEPASTALRGSFMADANSVTSRFGELSGQLDLVQEETTQAVNSYVDQMNTITKALAQVNNQLTKQKSLAAQPADLLDQRDLLLKNLSDFAHVSARFSENGMVTVSLGPSFVRDVVVDGSTAFNIGTNYNSAAPEKVSLVLDPYGKAEPLTAISSGKLAGMMSFREQVLGSSRDALDTLAKVFVDEVNKVQTAGIDAYGNNGTVLFKFDPPTDHPAAAMQVAFEDPMRIAAAAQFRIYESANNTSGSESRVAYAPEDYAGPPDLKPLADYGLSGTQYRILTLIQSNNLLDEASLAKELDIPKTSLPSLTQDLINRGLINTQIQTADSGARTTLLSLSGPGYALVDEIATLPFGSNPDFSRTLTVSQSPPLAAVATVPAGLTDLTLYGDLSSGQNLQIFTRDGRQLLGSAIDTSLLGQLITTDNGFEAGTSYSADYLNVSGSQGYKDLTVFYGARADVRLEAQWNMDVQDPKVHASLSPAKLPALLEGKPIPNGLTGTVIAAGALKLNGTSLGALTIASGTLQASDVSSWINNAAISGIHASASNLLKISAADFSAGKPLVLNTVTITNGTNGPTNLVDLAAAINSQTGTTHLTASIDPDGNLLLTNATGHEGKDIIVSGAIPNALGLSNGTYTGKVSITRDLVDGTDTPIELGFGTNGSPDDLRKLGFTTGAFIKGSANEDLLVFVTGSGNAQLSATYTGSAIDPKQALRQNPVQIRFDSATHYTVWDTKTNTELASRNFDSTQLDQGISYQGLRVSFTAPPQKDDVFTIDGNQDGTGNNQNMLDLVDLQKAKLMGGGRTLGEAYLDQVNDLGNVARQATIAQSALKVVNDQAISARDQISGVSMDQEAADLIRFQQAYQASAKVLQVAGELFDSILQVR